MIEVTNLIRRYGDFAAVNDVTFSVDPGEVVGLLGHNGAGKTTIMKMLTGYLEPSAGRICIDGVDVWSQPSTVQAQMGYLPENSPLYPELSVLDYLSYAARLRGLDPSQCVPEAVAATQLEAKALDPIATLSRGYKQRVGVAQAILHKPKFLVLDEPSNGLDPTQTQHMRALIRRLAQHATVILSTHIMQEVKAVCDRVLILRGGTLAVDERLETLQQVSSVLVDTAADVDVAALLRDHDAVSSARRMDEKRWDISIAGDILAGTDAVARALVQSGAPLFALEPHARDLESIFNEVNEADVAEVSDAA